ncbi:hypothetical protein DYI26_04915 [Halomonas litopenaei]|nr:hypothetical protein [Halomonas litopenaei]
MSHNQHFVARGFGDFVDRVGATIAALSLMGGLFTPQIPALLSLAGVLLGIGCAALGIYSKKRFSSEEDV